MKPVNYEKERPYVVKTTEEWIRDLAEESNLGLAEKATQRLLHTKSSEWSYEEELRLAIPDEVKEGQTASFLRFYPNELVELYLGYRMDNDHKNKFISLAKNLNPNVQIYFAGLAKRKYALGFKKVA
jgi:hypothetical protein